MAVNSSYHAIVIGGSAGSMPVLISFLAQLPDPLPIPVIIVMHRPRNVPSDLISILSSRWRIIEPEDKEPILPGHIYLAPQNYHLQIEEDLTFSLDYSETVNFSRPSIDPTFSSSAAVFGRHVLGILLSGANQDGARGICDIVAAGGTGIVQDPDSASFSEMPASALSLCKGIIAMSVQDIINHISIQAIAKKS